MQHSIFGQRHVASARAVHKRRRVLRALIAALLLSLPLRAMAADIPVGSAAQDVTIAGTALRVFTYRPANCVPRMLLLVFHGVGRNADGYRDHAKPLADAGCGVVAAPLFDKARFPSALYQYGGVAEHGRATAEGGRTVDLVAPLAAWAKGAAGNPALPLVLVGHSAGAQFLSRVAAFTPADAVRILIVDPSTWVMPSLTTPVPFGFGGMTSPAASELALRAYLARPVVVLLGTADVGDYELATGKEAEAQGPNRLERGRNAFRMAREVAAQHGWPFGWTEAEVPGVGHNATLMFNSPPALAALPRP
jgi:dienelactone hydrolase